MSTPFVHQSLRTRVIARPGATDELRHELDKLGCRRPLVLASQRTADSALMAQVGQLLSGLPWQRVSDIPAHSSVDAVERVAAIARELDADALVCLGGGSISDTAKAAAILLAEGGPLAQHASRFEPPATVHTPDLREPKLPILTVPLTASGAEATPSLGIRTQEGHKLLFWDAQLASRVIFLDPVANLQTPAAVMLATGMNGLAHCIEGLYSRAASPITSALALDGLRRFDHALRSVAARPQDVQARADLLLAAHISGMVLASARSCLHHAICHVIGATWGVGHGNVNSAILPHALAFNAPHAQAALRPACEALQLEPSDPQALATWISSLQTATAVPARLRDLGIAREGLPAVAERTLHERGLAYNPVAVTRAADVLDILQAAW